jgi:L-ascorbate metabolism protein UlaG (beta-lactamase superfamily)
MKTLFAFTVVAGLAHMPAQACTLTVGAGGNDTFVQPVALNQVSVVVAFKQATVLIDPVGPQDQYRRFGRPDIVILTRADPAHLSIDTMIGLLRRDTVVLAPQAVIDQLPLMISNNVIAPFDAGTRQDVDGIAFSAVPASANIPNASQLCKRAHGDIGVVIELDGVSVYF